MAKEFVPNPAIDGRALGYYIPPQNVRLAIIAPTPEAAETAVNALVGPIYFALNTGNPRRAQELAAQVQLSIVQPEPEEIVFEDYPELPTN